MYTMTILPNGRTSGVLDVVCKVRINNRHQKQNHTVLPVG